MFGRAFVKVEEGIDSNNKVHHLQVPSFGLIRDGQEEVGAVSFAFESVVTTQARQ